MAEEKSFPVITETWSDGIEFTIRDIEKKCGELKALNIQASRRASFKYQVIIYMSIFLGALSGVLSTYSINSPSRLETYITILSFFYTVLSSIIKFGGFEKKSSLYKNIGSKYASLEGNIKRQLSLNREDRCNAGEYLQWVSQSFDELFDSSPLIPEELIKKDEIPISIEVHKTIVDIDTNRYTDGKMRYEMGRMFNKN